MRSILYLDLKITEYQLPKGAINVQIDHISVRVHGKSMRFDRSLQCIKTRENRCSRLSAINNPCDNLPIFNGTLHCMLLLINETLHQCRQFFK